MNFCKNIFFSLLLCIAFSLIKSERNCKDGEPLTPYPPTIKNTTSLLAKLREHMRNNSIDGYIVPSADDHQTEYVAPWFKRRAFISGLTGSAGTAVITLSSAAVWTDGRYHDQADTQVDCNWIIQKKGNSGVPDISSWLEQELKGKVLGADPRVISLDFQKELKKPGSTWKWKFVDNNLIDEVWKDRPPITQKQIFIQPIKFSGQSYTSKLSNLRNKLKNRDAVAIVVQALDDVAWLLNLRGKDIPFNPFFYAFIVVTQTNASLFIDIKKINQDVRSHLCSKNTAAENCVNILPYQNLERAIKDIVNTTNDSIWITPKTSVFVVENVPKERRLIRYSPIQLPKAMKNQIEIKGMKSANIKDGIAIMEYFVWLKEQIKAGKKVTEISGAEQLKKFKSQQANFSGLSFETISGFGANGAIIHYKATNLTDKEITDKSLYLVDSGAHFPEGSTDITRTIHLGKPTNDEKEMYTYVLQGVIGLARVIFPQGTYGTNIDVFAREYMWRKGLNYNHGTGHGIGSYLSIHEGPGSIHTHKAKKGASGIYEGMIFSDEPGYYSTGKFGIRLETAVCVQPKKTKYNSGYYYGFEAITWVPFDRALINVAMLDDIQIEWLNKYYEDIRNIMGPEILKQGKTKVYAYMKEQTEPFKKQTGSFASMNTACLVLSLVVVMITQTL